MPIFKIHFHVKINRSRNLPNLVGGDYLLNTPEGGAPVAGPEVVPMVEVVEQLVESVSVLETRRLGNYL